MRFRKLRIAWSVFWSVAAVLLIVLWVRSFWIKEGWMRQSAGTRFEVISQGGSFRWGNQTGYDARWDHDWQSVYDRIPYNSPDMGRYMPFRVSTTPTTDYFVVNYWFPPIVAAVLATIPWLHYVRCRCRFSRRTLLIATTLVALVLGAIV